ncbi:uncharacterized protein [Watersipora subatra]|uniref:uncharacterized protein n=1 Tax=Watersipora subatra TaxID=2589382 RepID=UPI00355BE816
MATPHRPVPSESPRTHKQSVFNTALGYGYNVRVTMLLKEDSLKRSPSILSLCENIARKQRQLISSSNQTFHPWSSSSSSVNALVNSCDPPSYHERDNSSRQTSSSSSTSVPLEPKSFSRSSHHPPNKPPRHKANGLTHSHDRNQGGDTLPVVYADENANTSLHTLTLNTRQSRVQGTIQSISPSHKASPSSSKTQRINSLSISGIKQDGTASNSKAEDTPTEEEDNRPCQPSVQERLSSKQPPPSLQLYANTNQQTGANSPSYALSSRKKPAKTLRSSGRYVHAKQKPDPEPKYADPISGSATSFQARLAELASLEAETVRWERLRKLKKKPRDD